MEKEIQGAEEVSSNLRGGNSEEDRVVRKQSMVDRRNSVPKGEAWKRSFRLQPTQFSTKGVSDQNV